HLERQQQLVRRRREIEKQRKITQDQIATLQMQMEAESAELDYLLQEKNLYEADFFQDQQAMARLRQAD
ncbi:MAG: hypothetical protein ACYTXT_45155, partial [Nostoc sp.]